VTKGITHLSAKNLKSPQRQTCNIIACIDNYLTNQLIDNWSGIAQYRKCRKMNQPLVDDWLMVSKWINEHAGSSKTHPERY
jgi:hypothetical protein